MVSKCPVGICPTIMLLRGPLHQVCQRVPAVTHSDREGVIPQFTAGSSNRNMIMQLKPQT